jgi:hypothetical protein
VGEAKRSVVGLSGGAEFVDEAAHHPGVYREQELEHQSA